MYKPGESLLQSSVTVDSLKEQHGPYQANRSQIYQRQGPQETIGIQGCPYFCARYRRCQETQQVQFLHMLSVRSFIMCAAKLYPIFWSYPKLEADFRVQLGRVWSSGSENGLDWGSLTSDGVQIWIQDRFNHGHRESLMSRT